MRTSKGSAIVGKETVRLSIYTWVREAGGGGGGFEFREYERRVVKVK